MLMWHTGEHLGDRVRTLGAAFVAASPNDYAALEDAGIREAACIMPVSDDDRLNLQVALKARDLNPQIRVVLRQFNRALGRKIEQNLKGCSAISPATHAAATFAAAAVDPDTLYALQFPLADGPLVGFSERRARDFGLAGITVGAAEERLAVRIASVNANVRPASDLEIRGDDVVVACGPVKSLHAARGARSEPRGPRARRRTSVREAIRTAARLEPLLLYTFGFGTLLYFVAVLYFMVDLHITFVESLYFVAATMFTVGYGDITPYTRHAGWFAFIVAIGVMGMGVAIGGVFIATMSRF